MRVFVSGSISIKKLPQSATKKIDNIIAKQFTILVGDAKGVDLNIQKYLLKKEYKHVNVYYAGNSIRNNIGKWQTKNILSKSNEKGRELYTLKDLSMADDADYGLMIWDGESKGTLNNILTMKQKNKKFFVVLDGVVVDNNHIDPIISAVNKGCSKESQLDLF